ncbi:multiple epidermal growth factor domains protein 6, partial [Biomphalaria glabrata]
MTMKRYLCVLFLHFTIVTVQSQGFDCPTNWTGPDCNFLCFCQDDRCHTTGKCEETFNCKDGYFGFACQYSDIAFFKENGTTSVLTDNDVRTCIQDETTSSVTVPMVANRFTFLHAVFTVSGLADVLKLSDITLKFNTNVKCADIKFIPLDSITLEIYCNNSESNLTSVTLSGTNVNSLCDVHVSGGRNVAVKKPVTASSTYILFRADKIVDGRNQYDPFSNQYCFHSNANDRSPHVNISLDQDFLLYRFKIFNRKGVLALRAKYFKIDLFNVNNLIVWSYQDTEEGEISVYDVICGYQSTVRSLRFMITYGTTPFLSVCEIEAYGDCLKTKYGLGCLSTCSSQCKNSYCNIEGLCLECRDGFYGLDCASECPEGCRSPRTCDRLTGFCTSGCDLGYYTGFCDSFCPDNCNKKLACDINTGDCINGCEVGFHGIVCYESCPRYCKANLGCDQNSSECVNGCAVGLYGSYCNNTCSGRCKKNQACDQNTGSCINGCEAGFRGSYCNRTCPEHCRMDQGCAQNTSECIYGCEIGYYDSYCNRTCPEDCKIDQSCAQKNGFCISGCEYGFHGNTCREICPDNCNSSTTPASCSQATGLCESCLTGYYGDTCSMVCDGRCNSPVPGSCNRVTGLCDDGCEVGYYGITCSLECPSNCLPNTSCNQTTGICTDFCNVKYYGRNCTQECPVNCDGCERWSGFCNKGCINGFFGSNCSN